MTVDRSELYRYLTRKYRGLTADDVHEAVQYAVVTAYEASVLREPPVNVQAFVTTVAARALSRVRYVSKRYDYPDVDASGGWDRVSSNTVVAGEEDARAASLDVGRILNKLPDIYADVLKRHYLDGISFEQIAEQDGVAGSTIRKRHERAIKSARKMFSQQD